MHPLMSQMVRKMIASKLIHYFCSHPVDIVFLASSSLDETTLNASNKKTDQNLSNVQTCSSAAIQAKLDTKKCIFCTRTTHVDNVVSLWDSDDRRFQFQKCMNCLQGFMMLWTMLCLCHVVIFCKLTK